MFKTIGVLLIIAAQLGCSKKSTSGMIVYPSRVDTSATPSPVAAKTYLALGDSYTIGQGVTEADRYPVQTQQWLIANGIQIGKPTIIATTGWTTTNLQEAIVTQKPTGPYDVVSLLIGVNDQYQHFNVTGYKERFTLLLQKAIELAGNRPSHVFVLSIPDYSVTPFARGSDLTRIRTEIDEFNKINKDVTANYNCVYLDITPSTRKAATNPSLVAGDGLHPSGKEYKKWAERLGPLMKAVLQ